MLEMDQDVLRTHKLFHGQKHEKSAILRAAHGQRYAKILMLFSILVSGKMHDIIFIQDYDCIPDSMLNKDDCNVGFQQICLGDTSRFVSLEEFVCAAFIVNMDDNWLHHYFVNNLVDDDMYLCLNQ